MAEISEKTRVQVVVERHNRRVALVLNYYNDPEKEIVE